MRRCDEADFRRSLNGKETSAIRWSQLSNTFELQNDTDVDETRKGAESDCQLATDSA